MSVKLGGGQRAVELKDMVLAALVGMVLSLLFYILNKLKLTNDAEE